MPNRFTAQLIFAMSVLGLATSAYADGDMHSYQELSSPLAVTVDKSDLSEVVVDPLLGSPFNARKVLPPHSFSMTGFNTEKGEARIDVASQMMGLDCYSARYFCEIDLYLAGNKVLATVSAGSNSKIENVGDLPLAWQLNPSDNYNNIRLKKNVAVQVGHFNEKSQIDWIVPVKTYVYVPAANDVSKKDPVAPLCSKNSTVGTCLSKFPVIFKVDLSHVK